MDKARAREKIKALIEKYEQAVSAGLLRKYSEEETKKDFILPLLETLGWDVHNKKEVSAEEHIKSSGRVDYGFYINDKIQFYLEAKALKADIHKEEHARQAIRYSWNKGVTWAVLTDFESLIIFNTQDAKASLASKRLFEISYSEYLERLDQLSLLSRESFEKGLINKEAERFGKKFQKVPVGALLYEDLNECREMLTKSLAAWNDKLKKDRKLLDEGVQLLLDRLIFLRVAEDRGLEPLTLIPLIREWEASKERNTTPLFKSMVSKFRELDKTYDSNLFTEHPLEYWEEYDGTTEKVIKKLYGKEGYYEYDFKVMPADVLGTVYENYLGYKLAQSKKGVMVHEDAKKRKEQGIYYTPPFIVDYIVKNALGPVLDRCRSIEDVKKIKVLDPACGSGSFLVKALELINEKYKRMGAPGNIFTKIQILLENIHGVDLDEQAVEIARLNLLISALDKRMALPSLTDNIKCGNSLISGTDEELKKYFGANFHDKKPFNWGEEFQDVLKKGGFDVVIGNPPYIKEFVNKAVFDGLHYSPYYQGKMDIWTMFACISIDLLRDGGILSFIAPNNWITNAGAGIFRDKVLEDGELKTFIDFGNYKVFKQAGIQTMVFVFEKKSPTEKYKIDYLRITDENIAEDKLIADIFSKKTKVEIEPKKLAGKNITFSTSESGFLLDKLESKRNFELTDKEVGQGIVCPQEYVIEKHLPLLENARLGDGIFVLKAQEAKNLVLDQRERKIIKPFYTTKEISRYYASSKNKLWIIYSDREVNKNIDSYPKIKSHLQKYAPVITSDFAPFGLHRARDEKFFIGPSIFSIRKTDKPQFSYVDFPCYVSQTYFVISTDRANLKYLIGLLNSNLIYFWLRSKGKLQGDLLQVDKGPLLGIPICVGSNEQQMRVIILVEKMLSLHQRLHVIEQNSNEWHQLKSEIEKTDRKIDEEIFNLYSITPEEIKIIEGSE